MIVDFHTHIFCPDMCAQRDKYLDDRQFCFLYDDSRAKLISHEDMIKSMEESGIDHVAAMGFPWLEERFCREQNEYFSRVVRDTEGMIFPFGSIPISESIDADAWVKEIKEMGLSGIGEVSFYCDTMNSTNEVYLRKILQAAGKYSMPVCLHVNEPVGHQYPGKYEPSLANLYTIITDFPDTVIIFAHWGGGLIFYELMPEVSEAFKNCYYDTAASPFLYEDKIFEIALSITGPKKILFGSDFPLITFNRYVDIIRRMVPDRESQDCILGGNALRILDGE